MNALALSSDPARRDRISVRAKGTKEAIEHINRAKYWLIEQRHLHDGAERKAENSAKEGE